MKEVDRPDSHTSANVSRLESKAFQRHAAGLLRSATNDLKRDMAAAATDLGISQEQLTAYLEGQMPITLDLLERAAEVWPVNVRDLLPYQDDAPEGALTMSAHASLASSRIMTRGGVAYYEYRDTAMSRVASYRPEWIRMLSTVEDRDAANPLVKWNRGHLLYQFTYFIGPVNYYYRWKTHSACLEMETGDSVWGVPYAPHSFTSRSSTEPAYILALTYGDALTGPARLELGARAFSDSRTVAIQPGSKPVADPRLIRSFMDSGSMSVAALSHMSGISADVIEDILQSRSDVTPNQLEALSSALRISPRDLLPVITQIRNGVRVQRGSSAPKWPFPSPDRKLCIVKRLAGDSLHPHTSALEVTIIRCDEIPFTCLAHQYLYILESQGLELRWFYEGRRHEATLATGHSAYIKPCVDLRISAGCVPSRFLLLRIGGGVSSEVRYQLGAIAHEGRERYLHEDGLWFDGATEGVS